MASEAGRTTGLVNATVAAPASGVNTEGGATTDFPVLGSEELAEMASRMWKTYRGIHACRASSRIGPQKRPERTRAYMQRILFKDLIPHLLLLC